MRPRWGRGAARHPSPAARCGGHGGRRRRPGVHRAALPGHPPWLADHRVAGTVLVPGTALVELALHAGEQVGCPVVDELVLDTPLVLPERGGVRIQAEVGAPLADGSREIALYSRPDDLTGAVEPDGDWVTARERRPLRRPADAGTPLAPWPPQDAEPVDLSDFYATAADAGLQYGPLFQGLHAAWRGADGAVYAEVTLPTPGGAGAPEPGGFGLHPALFDAALHTAALHDPTRSVPARGEQSVRLPFSWSGVTLYATGATALRVRLIPAGTDAVSLDLADPEGQPVASVASLVLRAAGAPGGGVRPDTLFRVRWTALPVTDGRAGARPWTVVAGPAELAGLAALPEVPALVAVHAGPVSDTDTNTGIGIGIGIDEPARVRAAAHRAWNAYGPGSPTRVSPTPRSSCSPGVPCPSARSRPIRPAPPCGAWSAARRPNTPAASSCSTWTPRTATYPARDRRTPTSRSSRCGTAGGMPAPRPGRGLRTVRRRGDGGPRHRARHRRNRVLGARVARHLAAEHGVRELLLLSRRGPAAPRADELIAELAGLGAHARAVACDVADREALAAVLTTVPEDRPLTGVVHAAGIVDDGVVTGLTPERIDAVLDAKATSALHLDALVGDVPLFVLFSSASATFGSAGQAGYAAANAVLDALARRRPGAVSVGWGLWEETSGISAGLDETGRARITRAAGRSPRPRHWRSWTPSARATSPTWSPST
nr:SDR family oxidoreductase [Streptomyces sp. H-KF8]